MNRWCARRQVAPGGIVPLEQCWDLARRWYAGRTNEDWQPWTGAQREEIFRAAGLGGDFWRMTPP